MDPSTGLFDHAWFVNAGEADPAFHWARGDAWVVMAMAELLSVLPETHPDRPKVLELFRRTVARPRARSRARRASGISCSIGPDSYLETSATAMYAFAIARGVNRGWLPPIYAPGRAGGLAGRGAADSARRPGRGHLLRDDGRVRRALLLQPADAARRDAGLRPRADGRRRDDRRCCARSRSITR